ncbi:MAG: hypothetical protein CL936_12395 [Deltaproteobacteria bacterium]|nr:hypothetical protein [Deltaproteobacteria bacterium]
MYIYISIYYYIYTHLMLRLLLLLILLASTHACRYTKQETFACLKQFDSNADQQIDNAEILAVCNDKMSWYEKIVYPPSWVVQKFNSDCRMPLTPDTIMADGCFDSCFYRDSIFYKLCRS